MRSADFVVLVVDEHYQPAGVEPGMGMLYSRDNQGGSTRLKRSGVGVLSGNKNLLVLDQALTSDSNNHSCEVHPPTLYHFIGLSVLLKDSRDGQSNSTFSPTKADDS